MPRLYFIRHGETDWNREGRLQGQTDVPLNDNGRRQAKAVAAHLVAPAVTGLDRDAFRKLPLYVSPMVRAQETTWIILEALQMPDRGFITEDLLKEIGFGSWEGKTWPEIRTLDPRGAAARDKDKWGFVPPEGENYEMVADRVKRWIDTLSGDAVVVAHGGIARAILVLMAGYRRAEAVRADIWQGKVLDVAAGNARWLPQPGHH
jgi:probable phosphoglycerate mutase